ncbi:MAG: Rpn family recombination-promoting nuclease/putative transposase [Fibrobacter sp.]|nr:Rpn family recombination-promoting nuclease/putative transposase [Fibrobacter sp.]
MNKIQFRAMALDLKANPQKLAEYRKQYKYVYPFSDGIFKILMANEAKPERTIKFLNAMLDLSGPNAIRSFTLGVQEQPGILDQKTAIFDIYGTTEGGAPVLIEVQQNFNTLFVDRLVYYTARVISNQVKKSQSYDLPHIYVLSLLCENQFPREKDAYLHHCLILRNRMYPFKKIDVLLVEMNKFFAIDDRTPPEKRETNDRAEMLRMFRDVLEDKTIDEEKAARLLDSDFVKDVNFEGFTDELLLLEVDGMTDLLYEKQGSYLQGKEEGKLEDAEALLRDGDPVDRVARVLKLPLETVQAIADRIAKPA